MAASALGILLAKLRFVCVTEIREVVERFATDETGTVPGMRFALTR